MRLAIETTSPLRWPRAACALVSGFYLAAAMETFDAVGYNNLGKSLAAFAGVLVCQGLIEIENAIE